MDRCAAAPGEARHVEQRQRGPQVPRAEQERCDAGPAGGAFGLLTEQHARVRGEGEQEGGRVQGAGARERRV